MRQFLSLLGFKQGKKRPVHGDDQSRLARNIFYATCSGPVPVPPARKVPNHEHHEGCGEIDLAVKNMLVLQRHRAW